MREATTGGGLAGRRRHGRGQGWRGHLRRDNVRCREHERNHPARLLLLLLLLPRRPDEAAAAGGDDHAVRLAHHHDAAHGGGARERGAP
jgi:hypothetical protein